MADLVFGIAVSLLAAAGCCGAGLRLTRRFPRLAYPLACLTIGWILVNSTVLLDHPRLTRLLPFSNVIVMGNLQPPACGLLLGTIWNLLPPHVLRRAVVSLALVGVCLWQSFSRVLGAVPSPLRNDWDGIVCMQSTESTCSAAAAATLLRMHGLPATEQEMAALCLTRPTGTTFLGTYRGLKLKTAGTPWDVEAFDLGFGNLKSETIAPLLITVGVGRHQQADVRYTRDWGWTPGVMHTVVLLSWDPQDKVTIADPNVGLEQWNVEGVKDLYKQRGLRLVPREGRGK